MKTTFFSRITPKGVVTSNEAHSASTQLMFEEAQRLGISYEEIPGTHIFKLCHQDNTQFFTPQIPSKTAHIGFFAAHYKDVGKILLSQAGISVPKGYSVYMDSTKEEALEVFRSLQKPLVIKPSNATQGVGVFIGIDDEQIYLETVEKCKKLLHESEASVIVEEKFTGEEYRILASQEKVIGIINRRPANVVGDGTSTIQELIDIKNSDPRRFDDPNAALIKIKVDDHVLDYLGKQHKELLYVPQKDERVFLRQNSNISTGGDSIDFTDRAHPSVNEIALKAMRALPNLSIAGLDFMTTDITQPQTSESYVILEVNSSPGFSIHDLPYEGQSRNATREFLLIMFPELRK